MALFGSFLVSQLSLIICHIHFINLSVFIYTGAKTNILRHRVVFLFLFAFVFFNIAYIWKGSN